jgi:hypothetical protein
LAPTGRWTLLKVCIRRPAARKEAVAAYYDAMEAWVSHAQTLPASAQIRLLSNHLSQDLYLLVNIVFLGNWRKAD